MERVGLPLNVEERVQSEADEILKASRETFGPASSSSHLHRLILLRFTFICTFSNYCFIHLIVPLLH